MRYDYKSEAVCKAQNVIASGIALQLWSCIDSSLLNLSKQINDTCVIDRGTRPNDY